MDPNETPNLRRDEYNDHLLGNELQTYTKSSLPSAVFNTVEEADNFTGEPPRLLGKNSKRKAGELARPGELSNVYTSVIWHQVDIKDNHIYFSMIENVPLSHQLIEPPIIEPPIIEPFKIIKYTYNYKPYYIHAQLQYELVFLEENSKAIFLESVDLGEAAFINQQGFIHKLRPRLTSPNYTKDDLRDWAIQYYSTRKHKHFAELLDDDDKELSNDERPDYVNNWYVPIFFENIICAKFKCPVCGGRLVKYINPYHPLIDVKCNNDNHTLENGVKYFQIKVSNETSKFNYGAGRTKYFNYNPRNPRENYIHVGSVAFGYRTHSIKFNDVDKSQLIGYICIKYKRNNNLVTIIPEQSFVVLPKMLSIDTPVGSPRLQRRDAHHVEPIPYYEYLTVKSDTDQTPSGKKQYHNFITFNTFINTVRLFNDSYKHYQFNMNIRFTRNKLLPKTMWDKKYLKYKAKYIALKIKSLQIN